MKENVGWNGTQGGSKLQTSKSKIYKRQGKLEQKTSGMKPKMWLIEIEIRWIETKSKADWNEHIKI